MEQKEKKPWFSYQELRIMGISLTILSLGLAIAYAGIIWYSKNKSSTPPKESISTPSGKLK